jgi:predicted protein tyrosine phosphatase
MTLIVCGLGDMPRVLAARRPSHLVTLLDPASMIATPEGILPANHLRLGVNDIAEPLEGMIAPDEALVDRILAFGRGWDASAPMVVHCWAGISRSTASALILACDRNPGCSEFEIALAMRMAAPHAYPNRRIVALADEMLDRRGRLVDAVEAMGDLVLNSSGGGAPFDFAVRF